MHAACIVDKTQCVDNLELGGCSGVAQSSLLSISSSLLTYSSLFGAFDGMLTWDFQHVAVLQPLVVGMMHPSHVLATFGCVYVPHLACLLLG